MFALRKLLSLLAILTGITGLGTCLAKKKPKGNSYALCLCLGAIGMTLTSGKYLYWTSFVVFFGNVVSCGIFLKDYL